MSLLALLLSVASSHADEPVAIADTGNAVRQLVWARELQLTTPMVDTMQAGAPKMERGWLVQLSVAPQLDVVTQAAQPVLYAGTAPARPFDGGKGDGCVVALVHGPVDLATTRFFYGSSELPSHVDAARGQAELAAAEAAGVVPRPAAEIDAAVAAGGGPVIGDEDAVWAAARARVAEACGD